MQNNFIVIIFYLFLQSGKWVCAARRYSQALKQLILIGDTILEECKEDQDELRASCLLNLSACQGKLGQYEFVAANCTKVREDTMCTIHTGCMYRTSEIFLSQFSFYIAYLFNKFLIPNTGNNNFFY